MPLLDHFHAPLYPTRAWQTVHSRWSSAISDYLTQALPPRYFTAINVNLGSQVAADIAEIEYLEQEAPVSGPASTGGVAVAPWTAPAATMVLALTFPDVFEVQVRDPDDGTRVVAVIELVSPSNKDRPESRRAFAGKCAAYLQRGVGLVVVDIVTDRHGNLHNELMTLLDQPVSAHFESESKLYAVAYRPVARQTTGQLDVWTHCLSLGQTLPTVPLALMRGPTISLPLEETYSETCMRLRLPTVE